MSIALRIKEIILIKNLNPSSFEKKVGLSNASVAKFNSRKSDPSGKNITKILSSFPDISPDWLIFGKGPMFRPTDEQLGHVDTAVARLTGQVELLERQLKEKEKRIEELLLEISQLRSVK